MPVVNVDDVERTETDRDGVRFARRQLGAAAGGQRLGCSRYVLPPGAEGWPYHHHEGNEEALFVLSGTGKLRTPEGVHRLEPGDYAAFPAGSEGAHALRNDADPPGDPSAGGSPEDGNDGDGDDDGEADAPDRVPAPGSIDRDLVVLVVSTMDTPDVTVYHDADAFGVFTGSAPGDRGDRPLHGYFDRGAGLDYWTDVADVDDDRADGED